MVDFSHIEYGSVGLAVKDVQARLCSLGFELGDEVRQGVFGRLTADAVSAFRKKANLPSGEDVNLETWTALVDETFTFGDRLLYLRLPHFHGKDVTTLQTALAALGFSCDADGIFGAHTEQAVRDFQRNAGLSSDGIVGHSTCSAINRLRHAWEGKESLRLEARALGLARAAEVLEKTPIYLYGTDELAHRIAMRISNLAMATTSASRVVCVLSSEQKPDDSVLMIQLTTVDSKLDEKNSPPLVIYENDMTINARVATALNLLTKKQHRIVVHIAGISGENSQDGAVNRAPNGISESVSSSYLTEDSFDVTSSFRDEQHVAITLLDALCLSFS